MAQSLPALFSLGLLSHKIEESSKPDVVILPTTTTSTLPPSGSPNGGYTLRPPTSFEACVASAIQRQLPQAWVQPARPGPTLPAIDYWSPGWWIAWPNTMSFTMPQRSSTTGGSPRTATPSPPQTHAINDWLHMNRHRRSIPISHPKDMNYYRAIDDRIAAGKRHGRQRAAYTRR